MITEQEVKELVNSLIDMASENTQRTGKLSNTFIIKEN